MPQTPIPKAARLTTGVLSVIVLLTALAGVVMAWTIPPKPGWPMIGFEAALVLTGVIGIFFARGKFRDGPALTLACLAGAVFVASFLGYFGVQKRLGNFSLSAWMATRALIALVLGATSVAIAVGPSPEARRTLVKGVLWWVLPIAVIAWGALRGLAPMMTPQQGVLEALRVGGLALLVVATFVSLCGAVHLTVRAFEIALPPEEPA